MEKIEDLILTRLNNDEHAQFMTEVSSRVADNGGAGVLLIADEHAPFASALELEKEAMRVEQGSLKSSVVKNYDQLRDNTWSACYKRLKATLQSPIEGEPESAAALLYVFNKYGDVRNLPYNEETNNLNNLFADLALPENVAHLATLGMQPWVDALKAQNTNFVKTQADRTVELSDRPSGNVGDARKIVDPLYAELVNKINSSITMKMAPAATFTFVGQVNKIIKDCETTVARRLAANKKKPATNNTQPSTETNTAS